MGSGLADGRDLFDRTATPDVQDGQRDVPAEGLNGHG